MKCCYVCVGCLVGLLVVVSTVVDQVRGIRVETCAAIPARPTVGTGPGFPPTPNLSRLRDMSCVGGSF